MLLTLGLAFATGGCDDVYRLNHIHNDGNEKLAAGALDSFEAFTGQTAGLTPQLLRNLDARRAVETAVADSRARVRDTDMAVLTTDMTWERLRLELFTQLGLLVDTRGNSSKALNLDDPQDYAYALTTANDAATGYNYDQRLSDRIYVRQVKVTAIAKVFKSLGDAHRVLAAAAGKRFADTAKELEKLKVEDKPDAPTSDDKQSDRVKWVRGLFKTVLDTRDFIVKNQDVFALTNELQRKVLADIEHSRDPEEAVVLVPVVGAGLSDSDFALLDAYLRKLQVEFDRLQAELPKNDPGGRETESDAAWSSLLKSVGDARTFIELALSLLDDNLDVDNLFSGSGPRAAHHDVKTQTERTSMVQKLIINDSTLKARGVSGTSRLPAPPVATTQGTFLKAPAERLAALNEVKPLLSQIKSAPAATASRASLDKAADILKENSAGRTNQASDAYLAQKAVLARAIQNRELETSLRSISASRRAVGASAAKLRAAVAQTPRPAPDLARLAAKRADASPGAGFKISDSDVRRGAEFINQFLGLDVKIADTVDAAVKDGVITEPELKYVGSVVNDVLKGAVDQHRRLLTFMSDLYDSQADLGQENARHADVMLTVANLELRRWVLLGILNDNYQAVFTFKQPPAPAAQARDVQVSVFLPDAHLSAWSNLCPLQGQAPQTGPDLRKHAAVTKNDYVWTSVRKLTETVNALHNGPQVNDPTGFHIRAANDRLYQAVRTVDGHLLMLSLNQHVSEENSVRLRNELASHDVQLDSLQARVQEAEFRLTLGDLKAFHASGITQQDLQTIADGLLVWIGVKVN